MGSFQGHALAGTFFLQHMKPSIYTNLQFQRLELFEGMAKAFFALLGMAGEQFVPGGPYLHLYNKDDHKWVMLTTWQHTTMYLFFGIPRGLNPLMNSLALFIEGCLFYFHIMHCSALDQHIHFLLLISVFSIALCYLLEVFIGNHPALELFSVSMFLTQGSWFWQIGFVLYPPWQGPSWDQTDHDNIMFITVCFFWHYAAALLIIAFNYTIIYCCTENISLARNCEVTWLAEKSWLLN
uniref:Transmembrane protein 45B n=1 Tax=Pelusios castaneus TaxID=367368 RepID=A0A8C8VQL9_9SAUR